MFKYNIECKTKDGLTLIPLTMEGGYVICSDLKGNTVYKLPSDFDTSNSTNIKKESVVVAIAKKTIKTATLMSSSNNVAKKDKFIYTPPVVEEPITVEQVTETISSETFTQEVVVAKPAKTPGSKIVDFETDVQVIKDDFRVLEIRTSSDISKVKDEEYI